MNRPGPSFHPRMLSLPEWLLFLFTFAMMTIGYARAFYQYANLIGFAMAAVWALYTLNGMRGFAFHRVSLFPLAGVFLLGIMMVLYLPLLPAAFVRVKTYVQVVALMVIVFNIVRVSGRTITIEFGLFLGVLAMFVLASGDIAQAAAAGTRYRFAIGDEYGLNPNIYGALLNLSILFYLKVFFIDFLGQRKRGFWFKLVLWTGGAASLVAAYQILGVLGSRQNQLWLLWSMVGVAVLYLRGRLEPSKIFGSLAFGSVGLLVALVLIWNSPYFERFERLFYTLEGSTFGKLETSGLSRMEMFHAGIDLWQESPLWGSGNEAFRVESGYGAYSHNQVTELLANYGVIGFFAFYSIFLGVFIEAYRSWKTRIPLLRTYACWFIVALGGIFISNFFQPTYYQKSFGLILAALLGYAYFIRDSRLSGTGIFARAGRSEPPLGRTPARKRHSGRRRPPRSMARR